MSFYKDLLSNVTAEVDMWGDTLASIQLEYNNNSCYALLVTGYCIYGTFLSWSVFDIQSPDLWPVMLAKVIAWSIFKIDPGDERINGVIFKPLD